MTIKEQTIKVNVIACVSIISEHEFSYLDKSDKKGEIFSLLARENLSDKEIIKDEIIVSKENDDYIYKVKVYCRNVIYVG